MTSASRKTPFDLLLALVGLAAAAAIAVGAWFLADQGRQIAALTAASQAREQTLDLILGEVTRLRIERTTGLEGPKALLTRLQTFAPIIVSARSTQPDVDAARKEMEAVLRGFAALGDTAWRPLVARMEELSGDKNFDELKWLLEAAVRVDPKAGTEIVKAVLQGRKFPAPRLRWYAARMLIDLDRPLAQATLRHILHTESSRGINLERAAAYGAEIPDRAAFATTGFNNFVQWYVQSEDPLLDDTLLMVIGRVEHDVITVQECVEVLGRRGCEQAVEPIEKLFQKPPGAQENPLFQTKCLDALAAIRGEAARPFFEAMLPNATTEKVANHLKTLLSKPLEKVQPANSIAPPGKK